MESENQIHRRRLERLRETCGDVQWVGRDLSSDLIQRPWTAVTCSRLGKDTRLHGEICRFLARSMLDCRSRHGVLLVAEGSAAGPWASRAAELFGVDIIRVHVDGKLEGDGQSRLMIRHSDSRSVSRDAAVIALADRVDAVYVRPRGTIADCLKTRLAKRHDASTRVAVIASRNSAARELIDQGAIGWYVNFSSTNLSEERAAEAGSDPGGALDPPWTRSDGEWLVHCTRSCVGPWPRQTTHQYQDSLLLGEQEPSDRTPLESLQRILRTGRLVASAIASAKSWPVVCFSEAPLRELLDGRCFRPHLKRWDYEPYGIAIRKNVAKERGIRPVIYGQPDQRQQFEAQDQFRFQATGTTYDWRREREWRSPHDVNLESLDPRDVRVFVNNVNEAGNLTQQCSWQVDVVTLPHERPKIEKALEISE